MATTVAGKSIVVWLDGRVKEYETAYKLEGI